MHKILLQRLSVILLALLVGTAFTVMSTGCAHPYSGKPEKLKKPRKKKRPPVEASEEAATEIVWDEECRANFDDDKKALRRKPSAAKSLTKQANGMLLDAESMGGPARINTVIEAISKLKNALKKDQFNPEATFKLAVAYALVRRKGCALRLLERLNELQKMEEVTRKAQLAIKRATKEPAFDGFRKDADAAMGE
jgi:Flp pilus assembly protein TadD